MNMLNERLGLTSRALPPTLLRMDKNFVLNSKRELIDEIKAVERRLGLLREMFKLVKRLEADTASNGESSGLDVEGLLRGPAVTVREAVRAAATAMRKFTRPSLVEWIKTNHPTLEFSPKSVDRPLNEMVDKGEVVILKKNIGRKSHAVYGLKGISAD